MPGASGSQIFGYFAAVLSVGAAVFVRSELDPILGDNIPFLFNLVALVLMAQVVGLRPAMVGAVVAALSAVYLFVEPRHSLRQNWFVLAGYAAVGLALVIGMDAIRSARRRAVEAVRRAEQQRMTAVLEQLEAGLLVFDVGWICTFANRRAGDLLGRPAGDLTGATVQRIMPDAVWRDFRQELYRASGEGVPSEFEQFHPGSNRWLELNIQPLESGSAVVILDISERKRLVETLEESEHRFRALIENSSDAIALVDSSATVLYASPSTKKLLGYQPQEVLGTDSRMLVHEEDRHIVENAMCTIMRRPAGQLTVRMRVRRSDGAWVWLETTGRNLIEDPNVRAIVLNYHDITEQVQSEQALRESEQRYSTLAETAPVLLFTAGSEGCNFCSHRFYDYTGLRPGTAKGFGWIAVCHAEDFARAWPELEESFRLGKPCSWECRLRRHDGVYHWFAARMVRLESSTGAPQWFGVAVDIQAEKQAEQQRAGLLLQEQAARRKAEEASRSKDEFLAIVSHELRTPLTPIVGWSGMLRQGAVKPEDMPRVFEVIEYNAKLQAKLIGDLLDVAQITSGKVELELKPTDIAEVVRLAVETVRPAAEQKQLALVTDLPATAGEVLGDESRLQQVATNLLSNSIKFTPRGGSIHVSLQAAEGRVELRIRDTGIGIPDALLPHVFDRFRKGEASQSGRYAGLGLGLAIVKEIVRLHHGEVSAESPGRNLGAMFTVTLPALTRRAGTSSAPQGGVTDITSSGSLAGAQVLLVEDEPATLAYLADVLRSRKAIVQEAASAAEAVAKFVPGKFDLLVSDLGMPEEDGFELIRKCRALEIRAATPRPVYAIALTAHARREDRERASAAGFNAHMAKPIGPDELLRSAAAWVQEARAA